MGAGSSVGVARARSIDAVAFRPKSQDELAPSGARRRFSANVIAIEVAQRLEAEGRSATAEEQRELARWGSWGALPEVFDESRDDWADARAQLRTLLDDEAYDAARRTTINAHYTDPAYVTAIWSAMRQLGFEGGRVLEPGAGAGTFIGLAPTGTDMVGVELDPTTAMIARGLYPGATIRTESFADTRLSRGSFDAVVGNVPFSDVRLHDPSHNSAGHSMHNHFIVKSLALTRPGGMVAVLTSSFTMDAQNPAARRDMNALADLVGAVRLPNGAHRRAAGTEALTDLLIFRRREPGAAPADTSWETVMNVVVDGHNVKLNTYFVTTPRHVLGELRVGQGMYGSETVSVRADDLSATGERLIGALDDIVAVARERAHVFTDLAPELVVERATAERTYTELWDGTVVDARDEGFQVANKGRLEPLKVAAAHGAELRSLLELRDGARGLLEAEAATLDDTDELALMRRSLLERFEAHVGRYGAINRYTPTRTGRFEPETDPVTGDVLRDTAGKPIPSDVEILARRSYSAMRAFRSDPHAPLVRALERFDDETMTGVPATLLRHRTVVPRPAKQGAETPDEAIALSQEATGGIELATVARLLGVEESDARAQLGELVYDDPITGELVHAPEYLSGNVRIKLDAAEAAAVDDVRFDVNVQALRAALPPRIGSEEIEARMGAVWISAEVHQAFLREILDDRSLKVENGAPGVWAVRGRRSGVRATNEWGTERRPAPDIAQSMLQQQAIMVHDKVERADGGTSNVLNPVETQAAQERAAALQERFAEWVWEDPTRATMLEETYNRQFNSIRLRDYSDAGNHLRFPGLAATIELRPHQRAAVARMIAEPSTGLFHGVGAGKTLEMIVGATELRRMGLISKPMVVVPNHMLEQFSREWLQAYPQARILAAGPQDVEKDRRRDFVARAAANDWDGIVITQGAFKKIEISPETKAAYIDAQVGELREAVAAADEGDGLTVKRLERMILQLEEKHKKALDVDRDPGVEFEATGVDYVVVDEAHMYKNLATHSNMQDAAIGGSEQATDLHLKLTYLRERYGDRVGTMATATPLANSVTEAYVMTRYLRPDLLEQAGIKNFDGWAATFGSRVTEMELGPAGDFRMRSRFARFQNVPELLRMWHVFADVKTSADLKLPVPDIAQRASDGARQPETIVIPPTPDLEAYIAGIAARADKVAARAVPATEDNMLLISTDGRKAALDMRLVEPDAFPRGTTKLDVVATRVLQHWRETRTNQYRDDAGEISPVRGALQLVFSDLGTPNDDRWDAYTELRRTLIAGGMPHDAVRFMHDARNDAEKAALFAAARAGHVAVLIGSTAKMGVGTNVQARLVAMHHVDCPWRPADVEQRDGRGIRQGNQNDEVAIYRYVVERSFDAYSWQTVARKAQFIGQIMNGRLDSREIEDIGDTAMSATEAKALASGNPLVLEKATADAEYQRLRRREVAHDRSQSALRFRADSARGTIGAVEGVIQQLTVAEARTHDVSGDKFRMTVDGRHIEDRTEAGEAIAKWAQANSAQWLSRWSVSGSPVVIGRLAGHDVTLSSDHRHGRPQAVFALRGVPRSEHVLDAAEVASAGLGLVRSLENRTLAIGRELRTAQGELVAARDELAEAEKRLGQPFPDAAALEASRRRSAELSTALNAAMARREQPTATESVDPAIVKVQRILDVLPAPIVAEREATTSSSVAAPGSRAQHESRREGFTR